ncbi:MAG: hypothetical protein J6T53_07020 [Bacteroidales bacterium]|nr:hypothetical protein [Bacteroidales bacterium]
MMSFCANAQTDNIVSDWNEPYRSALSDMPWIPPFAVGNIVNDVNAYDTPIGDGLLILTALGAGYVVARKKRKKSSN